MLINPVVNLQKCFLASNQIGASFWPSPSVGAIILFLFAVGLEGNNSFLEKVKDDTKEGFSCSEIGKLLSILELGERKVLLLYAKEGTFCVSETGQKIFWQCVQLLQFG